MPAANEHPTVPVTQVVGEVPTSGSALAPRPSAASSEPQPRLGMTTPLSAMRTRIHTPGAGMPPELRPTDPAMGAIIPAPGVEVHVGTPEPATPRTQVWVATHRQPERLDRRLILVSEPDSVRAAAFRVLRHRLQEQGDPRIIAVTSARAKEGKTTCAVNLALALGEAGRARVLLVEANFRTPCLAPLFGFMPPQCFAQQLLRHKENPGEAWSVVEVFSPSLHVLAVKPDDQSRAVLDAMAFAIAIERLSDAGYDYIVVDTPAVLGAADVNLIEDVVDGVLFTAWAGASSARALRLAVDQLSPAKLLGLALLEG